MPKARRKYPTWSSWVVSPQGSQLADEIQSAVGGVELVEPLAFFAPAHVFGFVGNEGFGILVDMQEERDGECWRHESSVRVLSPAGLWEGHLTFYRWEAWLAFPADEVRSANAAQKRSWEEETARVAAERDRVRLVPLDATDALSPLPGLTSEQLLQVWFRVAELAGMTEADALPSVIEPSGNAE